MYSGGIPQGTVLGSLLFTVFIIVSSPGVCSLFSKSPQCRGRKWKCVDCGMPSSRQWKSAACLQSRNRYTRKVAHFSAPGIQRLNADRFPFIRHSDFICVFVPDCPTVGHGIQSVHVITEPLIFPFFLRSPFFFRPLSTKQRLLPKIPNFRQLGLETTE